MALLSLSVSLQTYSAPEGGSATRKAPDSSKSFLLQSPVIELVSTYADNRSASVDIRSPQPLYSLEFEANNLRNLELRLSYFLTVNGKQVRIFHAVQCFKAQALSPDAPVGQLPPIIPSGWKKNTDPGASLRTDGASENPLVHPLLLVSSDRLHVTINACFVDISEIWFDLWKDVPTYARWQKLFASGPVTLRFLALTLGEPLVWACAVPSSVANQGDITPLFYYMPADFGDISLPEPSLAALTSSQHKNSPLMQFILAPPGDDQLIDVDLTRKCEPFRNVVHHDANGPKHWDIDFGLARAVGACKRPYVLLVPQRKSGGGNGLATSSLVRIMGHSAVQLMRSQDIQFVPVNKTPPQATKLVLCGYSDSGVSLWSAAWTNIDHIIAVIGIEPQNLNRLTNSDVSGVNKRGMDILARFVREDTSKPGPAKRKFYLIGRHRSNYRPQFGIVGITEEQAKGSLVLLPNIAQHDAIFAYPPKDDAATPSFVKYRTYRLYHPTEDPLMSETERTHLTSLLAGKSGSAAASALFPNQFNADVGTGNWYSHNFAANGGETLALPAKSPTNSFYGVAVSYKTFFQEAIEGART